MSFLVSVDGQMIPTNGILANIVVGVPPTPGSVNTDFAIGTGADATVNNIVAVNNDVLLSGSLQSLNGQNGVNPSQLRGMTAINITGDVYSKFLGASGGLNGAVRVFKKLSNGKYMIGGAFTAVAGVSVGRFAILNNDFSVDLATSAAMGLGFDKSGGAYTGEIFDAVEQADGKIIVVGNFDLYNGVSYNRIVRLNTNFTVDTTFSTNLGTGPNTNSAGIVYTVVVQTDGKVLFGGGFASFNGNATSHRRIVRRNADGSNDTSWVSTSGFSAGIVQQIKLQSTGEILCCGTFTSYSGVTRQRVCRILTTGALDTTFGTTTGASTTVNSIELDSSGLVYIVGNFTTYGGSSATRIARLTTLGALDTTYTTGTGFGSAPTWICKLPSSDKMAIACPVTTYNGTTVNGIVTLATTGSVDSTFGKGFNVGPLYVSSFNDASEGDVLLVGSNITPFSKYNNMTSANGQLLNGLAYVSQYGALKTSLPKGGGFGSLGTLESNGVNILACAASYAGITYNGIIKMDLNGTVDSVFNTNIGTGASNVSAIFDINNKIICRGNFTTFNGVSANKLVRLNNDGTIDGTFSSGTGPDTNIDKVVALSDGKYIAIANSVTTYNGSAVKKIFRINSDGTLDTSFTLDESTHAADVYTDVVYNADDNKYYASGYITFVGSYVSSYDTSGTYLWKYEVVFLGVSGIGGINKLAYKFGKVYYGGDFDHGSPAVGKCIGSIDADTGAWIDSGFGTGLNGTNPTVYDIVIVGNKMYLGGVFNTYNGSTANNIVCINI